MLRHLQSKHSELEIFIRKEICLQIDHMSLVIIHMVMRIIMIIMIISYKLTQQLRHYWNVRHSSRPIDTS